MHWFSITDSSKKIAFEVINNWKGKITEEERIIRNSEVLNSGYDINATGIFLNEMYLK